MTSVLSLRAGRPAFAGSSPKLGFAAQSRTWSRRLMLDLQLAAELDDAVGRQLEELHRAFGALASSRRTAARATAPCRAAPWSAISFWRPRKKLVLIMLNGPPHDFDPHEVARARRPRP